MKIIHAFITAIAASNVTQIIPALVASQDGYLKIPRTAAEPPPKHTEALALKIPVIPK
jgi:hypothetical protein